MNVIFKNNVFLLNICCFAGSIYCIGGMDSTGHSLSSVERYNLSNGRVSIEASMISPRSGVGVAVLDGKLYAVGEYCI